MRFVLLLLAAAALPGCEAVMLASNLYPALSAAAASAR
jgi:hypothetical protein